MIDGLLAAAPGWGVGVQVGPGDDAAVLAGPGGDRVVTTDALVEGVHFKRAWLSWGDLAARAVAVNVSDLAAMGAEPTTLLLSLVGPAEAFGEAFARGLSGACRRYGLVLVGGNVSRSPGPIVVSVTAEGRVPEDGRPLLRSGARPDDDLWVSGPLGLAALGLRALQHDRAAEVPRAVEAFLRPRPRLALGQELSRLAAQDRVHAAMDLSDGLAADLPRLCLASGVGAQVRASGIPGPGQVPDWAGEPMDLVLSGGEDYELLVAAPPEARSALRDLEMHPIGQALPERAVLRWEDGDGRPLVAAAGWDHYSFGLPDP